MENGNLNKTLSSKFIRLEQTKTKLAGDSFSITAVDADPYESDESVNTDYGKTTITGVGTAFNSALNVGDVIQFCTDTASYDKYITNTAGNNYRHKYSVNYEVILEEYIVTAKSGSSDIEVFVKPYTDYEEEFKLMVARAVNYLCVSSTRSAYDKAAGTGNVKICSPILFYTVYKKNLTNSKTNDYVVNIDDIKYFKINASNAQDMDVIINSGDSASTTLAVHNCFDYLNHVLTPYTQIEPQRVFYNYLDSDLTLSALPVCTSYTSKHLISVQNRDTTMKEMLKKKNNESS
jgi:hypothetical protein